MQFKGKLNNQTLENGKKKKKKFGPDFGPFWFKFIPKKMFFEAFTSTVCYTLLQAIILCSFKEN